MAPPVMSLTAPWPDVVPQPPQPPRSNREEDSMNLEPSQSGRQIVGVIFPPAEIRNIVDKTAGFVARNGVEFENRIRQNELGNDKFKFLNPDNPYHAYYQSKVKEIRDGVAIESSIARPVITSRLNDTTKRIEFIPKEPPADFEFLAEPATINAYELDLIKMTALFCARNGRHFMTQLMNREARNYQFDFLKPQHSNFPYFTKLVEQFTKVLIPAKTMMTKVESELKEPSKVVDDVKYRVAWERHQRRLREREQAELERERQAYASIDWHDFVVVQTVDFPPNETTNLPPPCTPRDVGARILAQGRIEVQKSIPADIEMEMEDSDEEQMDEGGDDKQTPSDEQNEKPVPDKRVPEPPENVVLPVDSLKVRKDYNPRNKLDALKQTEKYVISPLTGEKVPADKLADHMRFNTVDSQYFMQKEKELADRTEEPWFASGMDVSSALRGFAERRTDIFGVGSKGAEQTAIGQKLVDEDKHVDPRSLWDGRIQSINQTQRYAQSKITIEQQLADIQRITGIDPEKERIGPKSDPVPPPPPPASNQPPIRAPARPDYPSIKVSAWEETQPPKTRPKPMPMPGEPRNPNMMPLGGGFDRAPTSSSTAQQSLPPAPPPTQLTAGLAHALNIPVPSAPPPVYASMSGGNDDEPSGKRAKATTDDPFIPEDIWLEQHSGIVQFPVVCPVYDTTEWNLRGQTLSFEMNMTETMGALKQKIQDQTLLPVTKQKLAVEGIFVKDQNTLAYYNMFMNKVVQLGVKERGGKKK